MKKTILVAAAAVLLAGCSGPAENQSAEIMKTPAIQPSDVLAQVNLTVDEGKRLIAEGIANDEAVKAHLASGMVIVTRGTTNTYIAERLAGLAAPHGSFMTGHIVPAGRAQIDVEKTGEIVLVDGVQVEMPFAEALDKMTPGDIIFKGGNLLNYAKQQAAVDIGAPDGGTTGRLRPVVEAGKAALIVPIGLEKECSWDLSALEAACASGNERVGFVPKLWVHKDARIYTEIEALRTLAGVEAFPVAAGGIAGREGGITLVVAGSREQVDKALAAVAAVQGQKPFIE